LVRDRDGVLHPRARTAGTRPARAVAARRAVGLGRGDDRLSVALSSLHAPRRAQQRCHRAHPRIKSSQKGCRRARLSCRD
jgi:hypothetical protein